MSITRPTLKDVAERSGYALRTVKKVMSGDQSVREKTKEAVLCAAAELGYIPNRAASALGKQKIIKIAVVYSKPSNVYFSDLEKGFERCAKELFDYGLCLNYYTTTASDWQAQKAILDELLTDKEVDGVVFQPISADKLDPSINALVDAGKPVITVGSDAPNSKRLCFIGCNAYKSGRIGGQMLANSMGQRGTVLIVSENSDQEQVRERCRGLTERLQRHSPHIRIYAPSALEQALPFPALIRTLVSTHAVDGLFCTSGNNTITAGQILQEFANDRIALVGFDLSDASIALMRDGAIDILLDQKPDEHAYHAAKTLFQHLTVLRCNTSVQYMPLYIYSSECLDPD